MSRFDYSGVQSTAERLVRRFGQDATLTRVTQGGEPYDPVTSETEFACQAAVTTYSQSLVDGTRIRADDRQIYLSTEDLTITPTTADTLTVGGVELSIISVRPLNPGGTVVFYEIQARN